MLKAGGVALLALGLALAGCAGEGPRGDRGRPPARAQLAVPASLEAYLGLLRQRLHLSPQQEAQAKPALEEELRRRAEVKSQYDKADLRQQGKQMAEDLRKVQEETLRRLGPVLSVAQYDALVRLQREMSLPGGPGGPGGPGKGPGGGPGGGGMGGSGE